MSMHQGRYHWSRALYQVLERMHAHTKKDPCYHLHRSARAQMMLLGPQVNYMPSKSHVIVLLIITITISSNLIGALVAIFFSNHLFNRTV